jgi:hypothetical protein
MGWTLVLTDEAGGTLQETYAVLDDELAEYLGGLEGFPCLQKLGTLPSSEDTPFAEEAREALGREVAELAGRARRREVPQPPDWVGLEGTGDIRLGEELGWRGLLEFLRRLEHLLHLARQMGLGLWATAED